jgi:hypothetical protein
MFGAIIMQDDLSCIRVWQELTVVVVPMFFETPTTTELFNKGRQQLRSSYLPYSFLMVRDKHRFSYLLRPEMNEK